MTWPDQSRAMTAARPPQNRARQRPYHRHGQGLVTKAIPYLVERVKDPALRDDALTPVERGARAWRTEVVQDLGGPEAIPAARAAWSTRPWAPRSCSTPSTDTSSSWRPRVGS